MSKTYYMRTSAGEVFTTLNPEWHAECENLGTGAKGKAARQEYARAELRKLVKPGHRIYCVLRSVSKSGMSRCISSFNPQPKETRPGYETLIRWWRMLSDGHLPRRESGLTGAAWMRVSTLFIRWATHCGRMARVNRTARVTANLTRQAVMHSNKNGFNAPTVSTSG